MNSLPTWILSQTTPPVIPILAYPGAALVDYFPKDLVTDPTVQFHAQRALHARYNTQVLLTAMDLSLEAEAFGCELSWSDMEPPTVIGRLVSSRAEAEAMAVPQVGSGRASVPIETTRRLVAEFPRVPILAGMIGPFSLAARLFGVSETLALTLEDPELTGLLVDKATSFLIEQASHLKKAGAWGVLVAEPTAGLLSPRGLREWSSAAVRKLTDAVQEEGFSVILHNCAARPVHLPAILQAGAAGYHFGAPMDLEQALQAVPPNTIICGNLDPARIFVHSDPCEVAEAARQLLAKHRRHKNFVLSSGCDIPAKTSLDVLDAFFATVGSFPC